MSPSDLQRDHDKAYHMNCNVRMLSDSSRCLELFEQDPDKYAPQNGGFCTFGVSVGALFPVDINTWQVYNDKLYLNLNLDILEMFKKDMDGNIAKAAKNWPGLVEKNAK